MNKEKENNYQINPPLTDFNQNGYLKSYGYQNLTATLIDIHLSNTEFGLGESLPGNLAWVLVSMHIEIKRPLKLHEKFYGRTWHSSRRGPFFRRDFEFLDNDNNIIFHGTTFSVLLNLTERTIFLKKELPFTLLAENDEQTIEATPNFNGQSELEEIEKRIVRNSFIDPLGHMNNEKYGEVAYDALSIDLINKMADLKRTDLYFHSEMSLEDEFIVKQCVEKNKVIIQLDNQTKDKKAFTIKLSW